MYTKCTCAEQTVNVHAELNLVLAVFTVCFFVLRTLHIIFLRQEAHGPRVAHLSSIASADMQMLCNIFRILSSQLMKSSSFKQFLILKKNIIYGMTVNGA